MREIIFRRAHFNHKGEFMCFTYWGKIDHKGNADDRCFQSPSNVSGCLTYIDYQFTGLTDKNATKIFEGDILRKPPLNDWEKVNYVSYEVFFHENDHCESSVGFQMNRHRFHGSICGTQEYYKFIPVNTIKFEIIGNIHDNG